MQKLIKRFCFDSGHCFLWCDHSFIYKITGDLKCCLCCSLSVSCLQEKQLTVLDRKLHILHIAVMCFQFHGNFHELLVALRQILLQLCDRLWCTDTCHNVLALCIDQVFAINTLCAGRRVSCEGYACTACLTHVTEYHCLHVNGCSPVARNIIHSSVNDSTLIIPGTEYGFDSFHQLYLRILWKILSHLVLVDCFKTCDHFLQIFCSQFHIKFDLFCCFDLIQNTLKQ